MRLAFFFALALPALAAWADPPHVGRAAMNEYRDYQDAPDHRAFAIAPGGAWGWSAGKASAEAAEEEALASCQGQTQQRCVRYALDDRIVFDAAAWPKSWRPYATSAQARQAASGHARGERMFDIAYADAAGRKQRLSGLRGKVVVLHFWGSWCPPCRHEMPDLQKFQQSVAGNRDIAFVTLQAREAFDVSRQWAAKQGLSLPLADSGSQGELDANIRLADGTTIKDREIANRYPTTYVLDRHGVVVFSHVGPIPDWSQYADFLKDLAAHAPR